MTRSMKRRMVAAGGVAGGEVTEAIKMKVVKRLENICSTNVKKMTDVAKKNKASVKKPKNKNKNKNSKGNSVSKSEWNVDVAGLGRIDVLAALNVHDRDQHIRFQEEGHIYYVKGQTGYTSSTKFAHSFSKPFDADAIIKRMLASGKNKKYEGMTPFEIKQMWKQNGAQASSMGTKMHYAIEAYYNDIARADALGGDSAAVVLDDQLWNGLDDERAQFTAFCENIGGLYPFRTEWCIYHEELKMTGSVDMVFKNANGGYDIYDWKRSKEIKTSAFNNFSCEAFSHLPDCNFWQYTIQLNVYKYILESKYGMRIDNLFLVAMHPEHPTFKRINAPVITNELVECFKEVGMLSDE